MGKQEEISSKLQNFCHLTSKYLTAPEKSVILQFPAFGHSVIRGLVTNRLMVRREFYYLLAWITIVPQREVAYNSNLAVTIALFRYCQIFTLLRGRNSAVCC